MTMGIELVKDQRFQLLIPGTAARKALLAFRNKVITVSSRERSDTMETTMAAATAAAKPALK